MCPLKSKTRRAALKPFCGNFIMEGGMDCHPSVVVGLRVFCWLSALALDAISCGFQALRKGHGFTPTVGLGFRCRLGAVFTLSRIQHNFYGALTPESLLPHQYYMRFYGKCQSYFARKCFMQGCDTLIFRRIHWKKQVAE